jgi:hypothetical protein
MLNALRERLKGPITKIGVMLTSLAFVSRWVGAGKFWLHILQWSWERIAWLKTDLGRVCLLIVGLGLIWWDQVRRKNARAHDLTTLRGRTLALRDKLKDFLEGAGPLVQSEFNSTHQVGYIKRVEDEESRRVSRLLHGYELHFASAVLKTYHEYGEMGYSDTELQAIILRPYKNEECYEVLINALGRLAEQTPVMEARPDLSWSQIGNLTLEERRAILEGKKP